MGIRKVEHLNCTVIILMIVIRSSAYLIYANSLWIVINNHIIDDYGTRSTCLSELAYLDSDMY